MENTKIHRKHRTNTYNTKEGKTQIQKDRTTCRQTYRQKTKTERLTERRNERKTNTKEIQQNSNHEAHKERHQEGTNDITTHNLNTKAIGPVILPIKVINLVLKIHLH